MQRYRPSPETTVYFVMFAALVGFLSFLLIKGMEDQFCIQQKHEAKLCEADHWHSEHCYQVFKQRQNDDCEPNS